MDIIVPRRDRRRLRFNGLHGPTDSDEGFRDEYIRNYGAFSGGLPGTRAGEALVPDDLPTAIKLFDPNVVYWSLLIAADTPITERARWLRSPPALPQNLVIFRGSRTFADSFRLAVWMSLRLGFVPPMRTLFVSGGKKTLETEAWNIVSSRYAPPVTPAFVTSRTTQSLDLLSETLGKGIGLYGPGGGATLQDFVGDCIAWAGKVNRLRYEYEIPVYDAEAVMEVGRQVAGQVFQKEVEEYARKCGLASSVVTSVVTAAATAAATNFLVSAGVGVTAGAASGAAAGAAGGAVCGPPCMALAALIGGIVGAVMAWLGSKVCGQLTQGEIASQIARFRENNGDDAVRKLIRTAYSIGFQVPDYAISAEAIGFLDQEIRNLGIGSAVEITLFVLRLENNPNIIQLELQAQKTVIEPELATAFKKVVGCDISPEYLKTLTDKYYSSRWDEPSDAERFLRVPSSETRALAEGQGCMMLDLPTSEGNKKVATPPSSTYRDSILGKPKEAKKEEPPKKEAPSPLPVTLALGVAGGAAGGIVGALVGVGIGLVVGTKKE